jgi:flagellar basal body rod protein FlgG
MIYGLYLSATGVLTSTYRQDVIANNLANSETVGFKKDLAQFRQRPVASQEAQYAGMSSNDLLDHISGGLLAEPTRVDLSQGPLMNTGSNMDAAISGSGMFEVQSGANIRLTRNGQFQIDSQGNLVLANDRGQQVLGDDSKPIQIDTSLPITIGSGGQIAQGGKVVAQIGLFDAPKPADLHKEGDGLYSYPNMKSLTPATGSIMGKTLEQSNVDPTTEMTNLMDAERQLEANMNMIRYQDATLSALVNTVGKVS